MAKYQGIPKTVSEHSSPAAACGELTEIHYQEQNFGLQMKCTQSMLWEVANALSSWEVKFTPVLKNCDPLLEIHFEDRE